MKVGCLAVGVFFLFFISLAVCVGEEVENDNWKIEQTENGTFAYKLDKYGDKEDEPSYVLINGKWVSLPSEKENKKEEEKQEKEEPAPQQIIIPYPVYQPIPQPQQQQQDQQNPLEQMLPALMQAMKGGGGGGGGAPPSGGGGGPTMGGGGGDPTMGSGGMSTGTMGPSPRSGYSSPGFQRSSQPRGNMFPQVRLSGNGLDPANHVFRVGGKSYTPEGFREMAEGLPDGPLKDYMLAVWEHYKKQLETQVKEEDKNKEDRIEPKKEKEGQEGGDGKGSDTGTVTA